MEAKIEENLEYKMYANVYFYHSIMEVTLSSLQGLQQLHGRIQASLQTIRLYSHHATRVTGLDAIIAWCQETLVLVMSFIDICHLF